MNRIANRHLFARTQSPILSVLFSLSILPLLLGGSVWSQQSDEFGEGGAGDPPPQEDLIVQVYQLMHADPVTIRDAAFSLRESGDIRVAMDPRTNSLIVQANRKSLESLEALIKKLDRPLEVPLSQPNTPVKLLVQLITDFDDEAGSIPLANPVDPRMGEILSEAAAAGLIRPLQQPQVVTHSLISVTPGDPQGGAGKIVTASSAAEESVRLELNGSLQQQEEDTFQLSTRIQIMLRQAGEAEKENVRTASAQIQTDTTLSKNHPILLSVNTIDGRSFLVMVEVR